MRQQKNGKSFCLELLDEKVGFKRKVPNTQNTKLAIPLNRFRCISRSVLSSLEVVRWTTLSYWGANLSEG